MDSNVSGRIFERFFVDLTNGEAWGAAAVDRLLELGIEERPARPAELIEVFRQVAEDIEA